MGMTAARRAELDRASGYYIFMFHGHMPPLVTPGTRMQAEFYTRFNAMRGYRDIVRWFAKYGIRHVINMTPSLMELLDLYAHGGSDTYLEICKKAAGDLRPDEKKFMLECFFPTNPAEEPNISGLSARRYRELREMKERHQSFSAQDFRDLQVWHCLSMSGYGLRKGVGEREKGNPVICRLIEKDRNFTEEDKRELIEVQLREIREIIPTLRRHQESGQISLITSPGFHPISPLLVTQDVARLQPGDVLPHSSHPDDAREQYWLARIIYERFMGGLSLRGMWPSEGCVSPYSVRMAKQVIPTLNFVFTDEGIRKHSSPWIPSDQWQNRFLPWRFAGVDLFFRDRGTSDRIGYVEMAHYAEIARRVHGDIAGTLIPARQQFVYIGSPVKPVFCVALDIDNFQRSRHDDGVAFMYELCRLLAADERIASITPEEYLELSSETMQLERLHSGSWINAGFHAWTGHRFDRQIGPDRCGRDGRGYERIHQAEKLLEDLQHEIALKYDAGQRQKAYDEINAAAAAGNLFAAIDGAKPTLSSPLAKAIFFVLQAQSSCFRWWYAGTQGEAADLGAFDRQFRSLLASAYHVLDLPVPAELEYSLYDQGSYPWALEVPKIALASR